MGLGKGRGFRRTAVFMLLLAVVSMSGCMLFNPAPAVLYQETFSGATASEWPVGETANRNKWIEGGKYHVQFKTSEYWWTSSWNDDQGPFDNFQLECDIAHINGTDNLSAAGLIFRVVDGDNYYVFRISPAGTYSLREVIDGTWNTIIDWTTSSEILTGAVTNHVTIYADGSSLTFFVNGEEIGDVVDGSLSTGFVGVIATSFAGNSDMHVSFDNIVVTELE